MHLHCKSFSICRVSKLDYPCALKLTAHMSRSWPIHVRVRPPMCLKGYFPYILKLTNIYGHCIANKFIIDIAYFIIIWAYIRIFKMYTLLIHEAIKYQFARFLKENIPTIYMVWLFLFYGYAWELYIIFHVSFYLLWYRVYFYWPSCNSLPFL